MEGEGSVETLALMMAKGPHNLCASVCNLLACLTGEPTITRALYKHAEVMGVAAIRTLKSDKEEICGSAATILANISEQDTKLVKVSSRN